VSVKILRLQDGLDIICEHKNVSGINFIKNPMVIFLDYDSEQPDLVMQHWIPYELVKNNETTISDNDILCAFEPNDTLEEYYIANMDIFNKSNQKRNYMEEHKDDMEQTSIDEVMDEFDNIKPDTKFH